MKKIVKLTAVVLLALCLILAVGCGKKDDTAKGNESGYVENEMPVAPPSTEETDGENEQTGMDNTVDIDDLLNPEDYVDEQNKNEGSGNSAKPSDGSSSSSSTPAGGSSTPSGSSSTSTPSDSSDSSSSNSQPSSSSSAPVENDMAGGAEADTGSYDTPGWIL